MNQHGAVTPVTMSSKPLKFTSVAGRSNSSTNQSTQSDEDVNGAVSSSNVASATATALAKQSTTKPEDISSPHELTVYVRP